MPITTFRDFDGETDVEFNVLEVTRPEHETEIFILTKRATAEYMNAFLGDPNLIGTKIIKHKGCPLLVTIKQLKGEEDWNLPEVQLLPDNNLKN